MQIKTQTKYLNLAKLNLGLVQYRLDHTAIHAVVILNVVLNFSPTLFYYNKLAKTTSVH